MDAFVQLALIEKAKRVFAGDPGVMLSFPLLTPLAFTPGDLAGLTAPATAADYLAAADFARAVNFLPRDIVANSSERMLWDIYRDVMDRAEVAHGDADAEGVGAPSILYDVHPDGTRTESETLKRYRQYRDAWFVAREDYAAHKLSGELAEDPAVRQRWLDVEEPRLRAVLDTAHGDWANLGQRAPIEAALAADEAAALRAPGRRWAEWRAAFDPALDLLTDPTSGSQYAPTGLSPRNFAEQDGWASFQLAADEMKTLVAEAPAALRAMLDDDLRADIASVSFQYRSVALLRPWFRPEALTSRIWRSADADLLLSDGAEPPAGICPAYPTACVFIRKVTVAEKDAGKSFHNLRFTLDPNRIGLRRAFAVDPDLLRRVARMPDPMPVRVAIAAVPRTFTALRSNSIHALRRPLLETAVSVRLPAETFGTPPPPSPPPPPPPPEDDTLSVLAFICRRLPKAPDPAPDLHWT